VLRNTRYLDAALTQHRVEGHHINDDDIARLSPLVHQHINLLGRYHSPADHLRTLRDPQHHRRLTRFHRLTEDPARFLLAPRNAAPALTQREVPGGRYVYRPSDPRSYQELMLSIAR
jgi:hypothetical protein